MASSVRIASNVSITCSFRFSPARIDAWPPPGPVGSQVAHHLDFLERGGVIEGLSRARGPEADPAIQAERRLVRGGHPEVELHRTPPLGPRRDRLHQRGTDLSAAGLRLDEHPDEIKTTP